VADDHQVVVDALTDMLSLEEDIHVIGAETDGLKTIASALSLRPDIIVLDISMPGCNGLTAVQAIRKELTAQRILILTVSEKPEDLKRSLQYGAQGYILKRDSIRDIVQAVRRTCSGEIVLSNRLINRLISEYRCSPADWENLNEIDRRVLQLFESGLTIATIASRLYISETQVKSCIQLFLGMVRFRLQNRGQALAEAERLSRSES
jgi:DNA-binding NarL/FixJ family response regulator